MNNVPTQTISYVDGKIKIDSFTADNSKCMDLTQFVKTGKPGGLCGHNILMGHSCQYQLVLNFCFNTIYHKNTKHSIHIFNIT
jgi:hypothetical protein